jgi:Xaa-Pro dipeptidase
MNTKRVLLALVFVTVFMQQGLEAFAQEARARYETMKLIRQEKFDLVLPGALRDSDVDMWIHVMQKGNPDALEMDLGGTASYSVDDTLGFFIFTDRGEGRIERAVLGGRADRDLYDIFGKEKDITDFVAERDPKRIAVNMSDRLPSADGMSYSAYKRLVKFIGDKYAQRLVSAENVITLFRVRRVQSEIEAFAKMCEIQRLLMEEAYGRIIPGVTTSEELGWWVQDQLLLMGLDSGDRGIYGPVGPDSRGGVYKRGLFSSWDLKIRYLNFGTDYKRNAYILREGETDVPDGIKHAWERGQRAREILKPTLKVGMTSGEALQVMIRALEAEGYIHNLSDDKGLYRINANKLGDSEQSGFTIDCHAMGNTGNSEINEGISIAAYRAGRDDFIIQQNNIFSFEFVVNTWVPERGRRMSINFEDNAIITDKGIEFLYPVNKEIIIIR